MKLNTLFKKFIPIALIVLYIGLLYQPFITKGLLPIPADTIAGLYHPWRDQFSKDFPSGVPFKNFQITDPVRQQYPWRKLSIENLKQLKIPHWNPYSLSGTPLLGNLQSAALYPPNILFFLIPDFNLTWAILVISQLVLGALFMYAFLKNLKLSNLSASLGTLSWIGCGFFVAWQQWNTVVHTVVWLPLILLSIDKLAQGKKWWLIAFVGGLCAGLLAGYMQPFFYLFIATGAYALFRFFETKRFSMLALLSVGYILFGVLVFPQVYATFQFILHSARDVDQSNWIRPDWFLPWQNLVQFIAPDYFGNPATLNYFGIWNYQEFVGYIGMAGLMFAFTGIVFSRQKSVWFFRCVLLIALLFALPNPISKIPFILSLPLISTSQPSRIILLVCFSLSVLAAFGLEFVLQAKKLSWKNLLPTAAILLITLLLAAGSPEVSQVSQKNIILPTLTAAAIFLLLVVATLLPAKRKTILLIILFVALFDLWRFGNKFLPFTPESMLFPPTKVTAYLQKNTADHTRVASIDDRIFAPNFSVPYKLQFISGYDPLYLKSYGEFIAAMERNKPDPSAPFGFNRILVPKNYQSKFFDLLGVKYVLSLNPITSKDYKLVQVQGETLLYENKTFVPRAFFPKRVVHLNNKQKVFDAMFSPNFNPLTDAVITNGENEISTGSGAAKIVKYEENEVQIETKGHGYLVLTDVNYPIWHAEIDGLPAKISTADHIFRSVFVPMGAHKVRFFAKLF